MTDTLTEPECPHCGSIRRAEVSTETMGNTHSQTVECLDCGEEYTIEYAAVSVVYGDSYEERKENRIPIEDSHDA